MTKNGNIERVLVRSDAPGLLPAGITDVEEALRAERERLRLAESAGGVGLWEWDFVAGKATWDDACKALFGLSPDAEVSFDVFLNLMHPEDRPELIRLGDRVLAEPTEFVHTFRAILPDGRLRWFTNRGRSMADESGKMVRMVGATVDVTREKEAEEALSRQTELLRTTIESTRTQIAYLDRDMRFVMANSAYIEASGHTWEELEGRNHFDIFPNEENEEIFRRTRDTGEPVEYRAKPFEYADQPWRGVTYWDWSLVPAKDSGGQVVGLVFSLTDVTHIKRAEDAVLRRNERLAILSDMASRLLDSEQPQVIVQELCERVMAHLDCQVFLNYLLVEERGCLHLNAYAGIHTETAREIEWLDYGTAVSGCVARDGERIVAEDIANTQDQMTGFVRSLGLQAYACHPLLSEGVRPIGTLSFGTRTRPLFTEDELSLMKTVADEVAAAMERIRLTEAERRRVAELQSFFSSISDGVMLLSASDGVLLVNQAARDLIDLPADEDIEPWFRRSSFYTMGGRPMSLDETASARALAGETLRDIRYRIVTPKGKEVIVGVSASPVRDSEGRIVGATTVLRDVSERFEIERRRDEVYEREHRIAEILQEALIPPDPPREINGYCFAVRHQAALEEASVGGDFYDIFEMDGGRIGVLIGDVTGKGLTAAIRVAAARHSIRSYAYIDPRPGRVLTLANEALCRDSLEESSILTAFFAVIDARVGIMAYANAGHELPVIVAPDGEVHEFRLPGLPLGIMEGVEYAEDSVRLNPGEKVVLVTDGITEARRPGPELFGIDGLLEYLRRDYAAGIEDMADGILRSATEYAEGKLQDDAALIVFGQQEQIVRGNRRGNVRGA